MSGASSGSSRKPDASEVALRCIFAGGSYPTATYVFPGTCSVSQALRHISSNWPEVWSDIPVPAQFGLIHQGKFLENVLFSETRIPLGATTPVHLVPRKGDTSERVGGGDAQKANRNGPMGAPRSGSNQRRSSTNTSAARGGDRADARESEDGKCACTIL